MKFHVDGFNENLSKNQFFVTIEQKYPALYMKTSVFVILLAVTYVAQQKVERIVPLPWKHMWYIDLLLAERSGDQAPVVTRFHAHFQNGPGIHPVSRTVGYQVFPEGKAGRARR